MQRPKGYWNKERCKEGALKYSSKVQWQKSSQSSYKAARVKNIIEECCSHMIITRKPIGYWNLETCKAEASKYPKRTMWAKGNSSSYIAASFLQILDECCAHML